MSKFENLASIVKFEGNTETLVWKHPIEDFNYGFQRWTGTGFIWSW